MENKKRNRQINRQLGRIIEGERSLMDFLKLEYSKKYR